MAKYCQSAAYDTVEYVFRMFGHGRALEAYLIGAKMWYGMILIAPGVEFKAIALTDVWGYIPEYVFGILFLFIAALQLIGLVLNLNGHEWSWVCRTVGAGIAMPTWAWLIAKSVIVGAIGGALPFWGMSFLASIFLFVKGWNRLPVPGAPGAV